LIYVVDFPDYAVGDLICIDGECKKVVAGSTAAPKKRDGFFSAGAVLTVDSAFSQDHSADGFVVANVDLAQARSATIVYPTPSESESESQSSSSSSSSKAANTWSDEEQEDSSASRAGAFAFALICISYITL